MKQILKKLQLYKWYHTIEELEQALNKYIIFSPDVNTSNLNIDTDTLGSLSKLNEQWIMIPKEIVPSPDGKLFHTKIYGYYICGIYPKFRAYHMPTIYNQKGEGKFYCNAQQSFRLATNGEIKQLRQYWSKFRITKLK